MRKEHINDLTDAFDTRLSFLLKGKAPSFEVDAAITVYERVRTARAICQALLPDGFAESSVVALAAELGKAAQAAQSAQGTSSDE